MRLFLAIDVPEALRDRLAALQRRVLEAAPDLRAVRTEQLHLTVLFLGEMADDEIQEVGALTAAVAARHEGFSLMLRGLGAFPSASRPRVLWAGAREGSDAFARLCLEMREVFSGRVAPEERAPSAHVTLVRNPSGRATPRLIELLRTTAETKIGSLQVAEVKLYASALSPTGPRYSCLAHFPLGCAAPPLS